MKCRCLEPRWLLIVDRIFNKRGIKMPTVLQLREVYYTRLIIRDTRWYPGGEP